MDLMLLRAFQEQVAYSCRAVVLGLADIQTGLGGPPETGNRPNVGRGDGTRLWYGVQNFVIGAGNVSKALWGTGRSEEERKRRYIERQDLRNSLKVTDASPLRTIKIRNDFEHLDERIEDWWAKDPNHNRVGLIVGPRNSIGGGGFHNTSVLRWIDPSTGNVIFWGNELNIPQVTTEVQRILPIAETESRKPHWETPNISGGG